MGKVLKNTHTLAHTYIQTVIVYNKSISHRRRQNELIERVPSVHERLRARLRPRYAARMTFVEPGALEVPLPKHPHHRPHLPRAPPRA